MPGRPCAMGGVPWTRDDLRDALEEFAALYAERPNDGGMLSPQLFATWFAASRLEPAVIVESGVFRGQGSWALERACRDARFVCIDPRLEVIEYRPTKATYLERDFREHDWSALPRDRTLFFFDDHQDALARVRRLKRLGFHHAIFEDNYPVGQGDCHSLKQALTRGRLGDDLVRHLRRLRDNRWLRRTLDVYYEFPPIFRPLVTRWGDAWSGARYATDEPLLTEVDEPWQEVYAAEAHNYTWLCYARIR